MQSQLQGWRPPKVGCLEAAKLCCPPSALGSPGGI
jgi:hypothetical protein